MDYNRRRFLSTSFAAAASGAFLSSCKKATPEVPDDSNVDAGPHFDISLAQWSMNRAIRGGELDNLDWPAFTKENFGITAVEWVNQFFGEKKDKLGLQPKGGDYIAQMKQRCSDAGVQSLLIMCDGVGSLGNPDNAKRTAAIEGHYAWLDAAKELGCHSIRVNAASDPKLSPEKQADLCADGLRRLSEHAAPMNLNVIVENHGALSSNGAWLSGVLSAVDLENCGSLPDYGNFYVVKNRGNAEQYAAQKALYQGDPSLKENEFGLGYDRYQGLRDLMPFAKGISAKAHDFDEQGNEIHTDFSKMMQIIAEFGYEGFIGIEYEGNKLGEVEGIKKTKALLEKVIAAV